MANPKNKIQNIPLTGNLCLNTLKTDVKPFEGFNLKNSTVFGGELTPFHTIKSTNVGPIPKKFLYNSKGDQYRVEFDPGNQLNIYKNGSRTFTSSRPVNIPFNIDLNKIIPESFVWAAMLSKFSRSDPLYFIYATGNKFKIVKRNTDGTVDTPVDMMTINLDNTDDIKAYVTGSDQLIIAIVSSGGSYGFIACKNNYKDLTTGFQYHTSQSLGTAMGKSPFVTINGTSNTYRVSFVDDLGYDAYHSYVYKVTFNGSATPAVVAEPANDDKYFLYGYNWQVDPFSIVQIDDPANGHESPPAAGQTAYHLITSRADPFNFDQYTSHNCTVTDPDTQESKNVFWYGEYAYNFWNGSEYYCTGYTRNIDESENLNTSDKRYRCVLDSIKGSFSSKGFSTYTANSSVLSVSVCGLPLCTPGSIDSNWITYIRDSNFENQTSGITYSSQNNWFSTGMYVIDHDNVSEEDYNNIIIDNRYILCVNSNFNTEVDTRVFDIETNSLINISALGLIFSYVPKCVAVGYGSILSSPIQGIMYGGGYNTRYEITNNPFVGYLMNPVVMTGVRAILSNPWGMTSFNSLPPRLKLLIQTYLSMGLNVQSAIYDGNEAIYADTTYPISSTDNIILPYTIGARIISGYNNNDMILINDSTYPLIYYNNTRKIYGYYLLSLMDGVNNAFMLQSTQYAVTDNNILTLFYDNGVISNVTTIAYKKNLRYLGTLPTRAIFYSEFNKTFYQFTGDSIITKMFEASEIDEIKFVVQNPATLSLWIATDKGIFVFSDTDMFKLNFDAHQIFFLDTYAIVISKSYDSDSNTYTYTINKISFVELDDSELIPISLETGFYGLGNEEKAKYDCWYFRLHNKDNKEGYLKIKVNTITDGSTHTETVEKAITPSMYDENNIVYIKYQPQYQDAVAMQLEAETDIAIYQLSLGINANDPVAQMSKFNF